MDVVRVGVVGGGLVSQAVQLPLLSRLRDRFMIAGIAEPSLRVRTELGSRYQVRQVDADHRQMLDAGGLDAVVVCTPHGSHASIVTDALQAGLHVFVEKPLCITLADADRIIALEESAHRVVQVGYTKRYDVAYEEMCSTMPDSIANLRYIDVLTCEPELSQYFRPTDMVFGSDLPKAFIENAKREQENQIEAAVGASTRAQAFMFSEIYLGSLIHDVNLVHGLLASMNERLPGSVAYSAWWDGPSATASIALPRVRSGG